MFVNNLDEYTTAERYNAPLLKTAVCNDTHFLKDLIYSINYYCDDDDDDDDGSCNNQYRFAC